MTVKKWVPPTQKERDELEANRLRFYAALERCFPHKNE